MCDVHIKWKMPILAKLKLLVTLWRLVLVRVRLPTWLSINLRLRWTVFGKIICNLFSRVREWVYPQSTKIIRFCANSDWMPRYCALTENSPSACKHNSAGSKAQRSYFCIEKELELQESNIMEVVISEERSPGSRTLTEVQSHGFSKDLQAPTKGEEEMHKINGFLTKYSSGVLKVLSLDSPFDDRGKPPWHLQISGPVLECFSLHSTFCMFSSLVILAWYTVPYSPKSWWHFYDSDQISLLFNFASACSSRIIKHALFCVESSKRQRDYKKQKLYLRLFIHKRLEFYIKVHTYFIRVLSERAAQGKPSHVQCPILHFDDLFYIYLIYCYLIIFEWFFASTELNKISTMWLLKSNKNACFTVKNVCSF